MDKLKDYTKIYEDELFKAAVIGGARIEAENVLRQAKDAPQTKESKTLNQSFQRAIIKRDLKNGLKAFYYGSRKISVFLVLFFLVSSFAVVNVEAVNTAFVEWVMKFNPRYTEIRAPYGGSGSIYTEEYDLLDFVIPEYIPEGFKMDSIFANKFICTIDFYNYNDDYIIFKAERIEKGATRVDTENADLFEEIIINNTNGYIIYKDNECTILWQQEDLFIKITANISSEELIKIANKINL